MLWFPLEFVACSWLNSDAYLMMQWLLAVPQWMGLRIRWVAHDQGNSAMLFDLIPASIQSSSSTPIFSIRSWIRCTITAENWWSFTCSATVFNASCGYGLSEQYSKPLLINWFTLLVLNICYIQSVVWLSPMIVWELGAVTRPYVAFVGCRCVWIRFAQRQRPLICPLKPNFALFY